MRGWSLRRQVRSGLVEGSLSRSGRCGDGLGIGRGRLGNLLRFDGGGEVGPLRAERVPRAEAFMVRDAKRPWVDQLRRAECFHCYLWINQICCRAMPTESQDASTRQTQMLRLRRDFRHIAYPLLDETNFLRALLNRSSALYSFILPLSITEA